MKTLYKNGDKELVIQDENNYTYGKVLRGDRDGKPTEQFGKAHYFNSIESAVRHICRVNANDRCTDLESWLHEYRAAQAYFAELFKYEPKGA